MLTGAQSEELHQLLMRATDLYQQGLYSEVLSVLSDRIDIGQNSSVFYHIAAAASYSIRQYELAEDYWKKALLITPDFAPACCHLGDIYLTQKKFSIAVQFYLKAIELAPGMAEAYFGYGNYLAESRNYVEALKSFHQAIDLRPDYAAAYCNMGNVLMALNFCSEAKAAYLKAYDLNPQDVSPLESLVALCARLNEVNEAEHYAAEVLALQSDPSRTRFNLGLLKLKNGDFSGGWPLYESRFDPGIERDDVRVVAHKLPFPMWKGERLSGKKLVIWCEQGFGDVIQFSRYVRLLKEQGASCITFVCKKPLERLMRSLDGLDQVLCFENYTVVPPHDYWVFAMSISLHLNTTLETIPACNGCFLIPPVGSDSIFSKITKKALKVGVVWHGSLRELNDQRSIASIAELKLWWSIPDIIFISFQHSPQGARRLLDKIPFDQPMIDAGGQIGDFMEVAQYLTQIDLLITVDTAIAHLAGTIGLPVWVMTQFYADWRWLLNREDSPWYPSMKLFRQSQFGSWDEVVQRIGRELEILSVRHSAQKKGGNNPAHIRQTHSSN